LATSLAPLSTIAVIVGRSAAARGVAVAVTKSPSAYSVRGECLNVRHGSSTAVVRIIVDEENPASNRSSRDCVGAVDLKGVDWSTLARNCAVFDVTVGATVVLPINLGWHLVTSTSLVFVFYGVLSSNQSGCKKEDDSKR